MNARQVRTFYYNSLYLAAPQNPTEQMRMVKTSLRPESVRPTFDNNRCIPRGRGCFIHVLPARVINNYTTAGYHLIVALKTKRILYSNLGTRLRAYIRKEDVFLVSVIDVLVRRPIKRHRQRYC
jgi:hypothetical protein